MRTIRRYRNRKLYDPGRRDTITLDGVARLAARGEKLRVVDHETGADITSLTLLLAMLQWEKARKGLFRPASLASAIRFAARKKGLRKR